MTTRTGASCRPGSRPAKASSSATQSPCTLSKQERSRRARKMVDELETNFGHCSLYGECADVCPAGIPLDAVGAINAERARAAFKGGDD